MPLFSPKRLSPRGIFAELLPHYFRYPRHPQQSLKEEPRNVRVPHDADEIFYRITFKNKKFLAAVMAKLPMRVGQVSKTKSTAWCVATGHFAPKSQMIATQIFPLALGSSIMTFVCGHPGLWADSNGLMLSKPVKQALDDWALIIVPHQCHYTDQTLKMRYKFHVMDSKHPAMSQSLYEKAAAHGLPEITTGQLHGREVAFANANRPMEAVLYHHACCAVWKQTYLDNPECDNEDDFATRFLTSIQKFWPPSYVAQSKITFIFLLKARNSNPEDVASQREVVPFAREWARTWRARAEAAELAGLAERRDESSTGAVHVEEQVLEAGQPDSEYQGRGYTDLKQGEAIDQRAPRSSSQLGDKEPGQETRNFDKKLTQALKKTQLSVEEPDEDTRKFAALLQQAPKGRQPHVEELNQETETLAAKPKQAAKRRQPALEEPNHETKNFTAKLRQAEEDLLRVSTHGSRH